MKQLEAPGYNRKKTTPKPGDQGSSHKTAMLCAIVDGPLNLSGPQFLHLQNKMVTFKACSTGETTESEAPETPVAHPDP